MYVMDSIHKICGLEGVLIVYIVNLIAFRTAKTPQSFGSSGGNMG